MASWHDIQGFIRSTYKAEVIGDSALKLLFNTRGLRTQVVFVEHTFNDTSDWIKVSSPIGTADEVDLRTAASLLSRMVVGGIVIEEGYVYVVNAMPTQNIDANEITEPLERVMNIADSLEAQLLGKDVI